METAKYDFRVASGIDDPLPEIAQLRAECPVLHTDAHDGHWILLDYADVHDAAIRPGSLCSGQGVSFPPSPFSPVYPIELDPPLHKQYRMPMLDRFSPREVAKHEPYYRSTVGALLDAVIDKGELETVSQLLEPMAGRVASQFLGFPAEDLEQLSHWAARLLANEESDNLEVMTATLAYFAAAYERAKSNPVDDVPSLLVSMTIDGAPMTEEGFILTMATLFVGGLDTTVSAGAHMIEWLAQNPAARAKLKGDRGLIPNAVEELLRYFTPLMALRRVATEDLEIRGCRIRAGESVLLHWAAANHDPKEFERPDEVWLERENNRHLAFGAGIHRCLGSNVARQSLRVLLDETLTRLGDWEMDPSRPKVRYPGITRGISEMWIVF